MIFEDFNKMMLDMGFSVNIIDGKYKLYRMGLYK